MNSINAVGVDIAPLSAMPDEEEVLLLPGLPLVNRPGENPEPGLWTFEVETPGESAATVDSTPVMIDYIHPGTYIIYKYIICVNTMSLFDKKLAIDHLVLIVFAGWNSLLHDKSWRRFLDTEKHDVVKSVLPSYKVVPK